MTRTVFGASSSIGKPRHCPRRPARPPRPRRLQGHAAHQAPGKAKVLITPGHLRPAFAARAIQGADAVVAAVGPDFTTRNHPQTSMTTPLDLHHRLARTLIDATRDSPHARLIYVSNDHQREPRLLPRCHWTTCPSAADARNAPSGAAP